MIKGKVLTILAALLGVTAACSLGVAAYIIIQPGTSPENGVAGTEAQLAGVEVVDNNGEHVDNDALPDISVDSGAVWTDSEVSNPEPESVISEPEPEYQNPGTHGGYLHEVGGARFYTEHDINQWLIPDEKYPEYFNFDIYQMLVDIWCEDGGGIYQVIDGFAYTNGVDFFTKGIGFKELDDENSKLYRCVKFTYAGEEVSIVMHDCSRPEGDYYCILGGPEHEWIYGIHPDLAPLILFAAEQMVAGSPCEALSGLNLGTNFSIY